LHWTKTRCNIKYTFIPFEINKCSLRPTVHKNNNNTCYCRMYLLGIPIYYYCYNSKNLNRYYFQITIVYIIISLYKLYLLYYKNIEVRQQYLGGRRFDRRVHNMLNVTRGGVNWLSKIARYGCPCDILF